MCIRKPRSLAVITAVVVGVLGIGVGRADAAAPATVHRHSRNFQFTVSFVGAGTRGAWTTCTFNEPWEGIVSARKGFSESGAMRWQTCESPATPSRPARAVQVVHQIQNTYRSDGFATAQYQFALRAWNGSQSSPSCRGWSVTTAYQRYPTSPVSVNWPGQTIFTGTSATCAGLTIETSISIDEAWSGS